jgi:hypothetical protein
LTDALKYEFPIDEEEVAENGNRVAEMVEDGDDQSFCAYRT